ncbi:hypothetical protein [Clostridium pasteurianum]|uniref:Uncharacterized protein n=1 Tax=Clostridium pasteurianum BC1 TaxID=86416 RepID=R4KB66_CLOPA|nr:hypothetical protein [Clostridium pasteurianum]AGK98926.1 hypothetical protein Clopa_4196 [Clostridium pasteurianum BC1]
MKIEKKYFLFIILIICLLISSVGYGKSDNTSSKANKSVKNKITQSSSNSNDTASQINNSISASDNNNAAAPNNNANSSTEVAINNSSNQSNISSASKNNTSSAVKYDAQQSQSSTNAGNTQPAVPKAASAPIPTETSTSEAATSPSVPVSKTPALTTQTFTGFITTEDDFAANLREDTAFMVYMRLMALSGLGITIQQNGQWVFYYFDGNISTDNKGPDGKWAFNGTASQLNAWNIVEAQVKENNGVNKMKPVSVTVTGTLNGNTKTNPGSDADGKQFPVITVKSITKN